MSKKEKLCVVGIGASAGGLNAISECLSYIDNLNKKYFCIIIAQHLSLEYPSNLVSILNQRCAWQVIEAENGQEPKAGVVYVTPPNKLISLVGESIKLAGLPKEHLSVPSIDDFFTSLSKSKAYYIAGVILSGMMKDGVAGAKALYDKDLLCVVQHPDSAKYPHLPEVVIDNGYYHKILYPGEILKEIDNYINNHKHITSDLENMQEIGFIFDLLAKKTGTDFSQYKSSTIMRRIDKRIEALELKDLGEYVKYIQHNESEIDTLFSTVLIGVTEFFRDAEAFDTLSANLKAYFSSLAYGESIRVWSVGCATGEEPYSIAILIHELLGDSLDKRNLQIFATDLDEKALEFARRGVYSEDRLHNLPDSMIDKYFDQIDGNYEVKKFIRKNVLFSRHDITIDPPFVKLNLVVCRNLLIYFNNDLQKETLNIFHYSLKSGGLLFLGKSESVSVTHDLFHKVDAKHKVFKRSVDNPLYSLKFTKPKNEGRVGSKTSINDPNNATLSSIAKYTLFLHFPHPWVVINENAEIKEIHGSVRLYLEIGEGAMSTNLYKMANREIVLDLRALITRAKKSGQPISGNVIRFTLFDRVHYVRLRVLPMMYSGTILEYFMVIFESIDQEGVYKYLDDRISTDGYSNIKIQELEQELAAAREHLQTFTEELETSNEELQSLNEELQSANEELKSSNEELETSNEELQSANEELHTANNELRDVNDALVVKEKQLLDAKERLEEKKLLYESITDNLPNGTMGIINKDLTVEFLSGKGLDKFNLVRDSLLGTKLSELNPDAANGEIMNDIFRKTFATQKQQHGTFSFRGYDFLIHTIPLSFSGSLDKIMYVTQDITELKELNDKLQESNERFKIVADLVPALIWIYDKDDKFNFFNKEWREFTGKTMNELKGLQWTDLIFEEHRGDYTSTLRHAIKNKRGFTVEYCLWNETEGAYRWVLDKGVPRFDAEGNFLGMIGAALDIHDQKLVEKKKDEFLNVASHELKTPLTSINAYVQLVEEALKEDGAKSSIELYIGKASKSLRKLNHLIADLLDVSRLEAGKIRIDLKPLPFDDLVVNTLEGFQPVSDHSIKLEGTTGELVYADEMRLEQVILNFLTNAVKFSPVDKEITVQTYSEDGWVFLKVVDQGIGIDKGRMHKVFDRFYQVDEKNHSGGIGLGLYISKEIIERHEGEVFITSDRDKGTTIGFKLRIREDS